MAKGSNSAQTTDASTQVAVNTTTKVGDIGLASTDAQKIITSSITAAGNGFTQLAGATMQINAASLALARDAIANTRGKVDITPMLIAAGGIVLILGVTK